MNDQINVPENLYVGRMLPNGQREIVNAVKMSELEDPIAFIRAQDGAVIRLEGNLSDQVRKEEGFPIGMLNSRYRLAPVSRNDVVLLDPQYSDEIVDIVDLDFFAAHYKPYAPTPEETEADDAREENSEIANILSKFSRGEEISHDENKKLIQHLAEKGGEEHV